MIGRGPLHLGLAAVGIGLACAAVRSERLVLAIRALDRRMDRDHGMFDERLARAWTLAPRLYRGLHLRAARDVVERVSRQDATVLDIGTGTGDLPLLVQERLPSASVVGLEPSAALGRIARDRGVRVLEGRAEALPLDDDSVDVVVSSLSTHHWDDPAAAFAEIRRALRPGGEGRLYDVRFGGLTAREVRLAARSAGLPADAVDRSVLDEGLVGIRPYSVVTIRA